MVGLLTMTGGASLVGVWVYRRWGDKTQLRREQRAGQAWWQAAWQRVQERVWPSRQPVASRNPPTPVTEPVADLPFAASRQTADLHATIHYGLRTSTLALGVTSAGWLVFPPLQVAGLPLLIYMGIPAAQQAYDQLADEGRPGHALAETVVLAVCLASGYYWVGSLGFWLYYGSRTWLAEKGQGEAPRPLEWLTPTTTQLWKEGEAHVVPTASLQSGDQVILHSGEMVPVDGLITEGVAWLRPQTLPSGACGLRKGVGDRIMATDIVSIGQICIRVLPAA